METFEKVKNIKELDELIDKTNKYLTKLLQDRTAMKTKIIVSIVKDIYKDYLYKKEKSDKKCQNKFEKIAPKHNFNGKLDLIIIKKYIKLTLNKSL